MHTTIQWNKNDFKGYLNLNLSDRSVQSVKYSGGQSFARHLVIKLGGWSIHLEQFLKNLLSKWLLYFTTCM